MADYPCPACAENRPHSLSRCYDLGLSAHVAKLEADLAEARATATRAQAQSNRDLEARREATEALSRTLNDLNDSGVELEKQLDTSRALARPMLEAALAAKQGRRCHCCGGFPVDPEPADRVIALCKALGEEE